MPSSEKPSRPSSNAPAADAPLRGLDDLLAPFHDAEKPPAQWRMGAEAEKFGVYSDGSPIPFVGERGVQGVLARLVERHGWHEEREYDAGEVISLTRDGMSITLEPGGQLELSGALRETVHQLCGEFRGHMLELRDVSSEADIVWLGVGFHPFAKLDELPWVPKLRYEIMRDYLPTKGNHARDMMQRTCTVQTNFDYSDEADAMRKMNVALRLQPIVTAIFANSPFVEGRTTEYRSFRAKVWLDMDPDRTGLLPFMWKEASSYRDYVEWALDVPMFLVKRGNKVLRNTSQTFRTFMKDGYQGERATRKDWETHLNTLFPEVRLKRTIEVRGADGQGAPLVCALPALWKGLLYDSTALGEAEVLASRLAYDEVESARIEIARRALKAKLARRDVAEWANDVLAIAAGGLERIGRRNSQGKDETIHLSRIREIVAQAISPADLLAENVAGAEDFRTKVIECTRI